MADTRVANGHRPSSQFLALVNRAATEKEPEKETTITTTFVPLETSPDCDEVAKYVWTHLDTFLNEVSYSCELLRLVR